MPVGAGVVSTWLVSCYSFGDMYPDVREFRDFYDSPLGRVTQRLVADAVRDVWPNAAGQGVLGLGYAIPYLAPYRGQAERVLAFIPVAQGVTPGSCWDDRGDGGQAALVAEQELPLADASVDRVLLVHGLENASQPQAMFREIWRVMTAGGRLLVIVPNRSGTWARFERTPFGHGRPYSAGQLSRALNDNLFSPTRKSAALFAPPGNRALAIKALVGLEPLGAKLWPTFAGVRLVEATKQLYGVTPIPVTEKAPRARVAT